MEFSGSLGDLGTLLPISIGMIMINGLSPTGLFISIGLFYILSGHYYGVTVSVQPMKVVGAYAIAMGITAPQIAASGLLIGLILLIIGGSGAISRVGTFIPNFNRNPAHDSGSQIYDWDIFFPSHAGSSRTIPEHTINRNGPHRDYSRDTSWTDHIIFS